MDFKCVPSLFFIASFDIDGYFDALQREEEGIKIRQGPSHQPILKAKGSLSSFPLNNDLELIVIQRKTFSE